LCRLQFLCSVLVLVELELGSSVCFLYVTMDMVFFLRRTGDFFFV
jgi:hypothetical protein